MNKGHLPGLFNLLHDPGDGADIAVKHRYKLTVGVDSELQAGVVFERRDNRILSQEVN
ncbi:hypothetical protein D3C85_1187350 [compost metagenome]